MTIHIKVCGFTRLEDLATAAELGVDAVGIVLDDAAVQVEPDHALQLAAAARRLGLVTVAVPGPREPDFVQRLLDAGFDRIQAVATTSIVDHFADDPRVVPVFFDDDDLVQRVEHTLGRWAPDAMDPLGGTVNVDGKGGGGTGKLASWGRAAEVARQRPLMLSGGLRDDNVAEAITSVRPRAVDVSSFTESAPGVKSAGRMAAFVDAVRRTEVTSP